jgi:hypothetical protein
VVVKSSAVFRETSRDIVGVRLEKGVEYLMRLFQMWVEIRLGHINRKSPRFLGKDGIHQDPPIKDDKPNPFQRHLKSSGHHFVESGREESVSPTTVSVLDVHKQRSYWSALEVFRIPQIVLIAIQLEYDSTHVQIPSNMPDFIPKPSHIIVSEPSSNIRAPNQGERRK